MRASSRRAVHEVGAYSSADRAGALGAFVALTCGVLLLGGLVSSARAQVEPAGAVSGHFLASPDGDFGGLIGADLWVPIEWFRIGGYLGVGAVPSENDERNRVFMPVALSAAVELLEGDVGFSLRLRGGLWAGATQEEKITAGGLVGGGLHLLVHLGGGTSLTVGVDAYGLFGAGETLVVAPGLGLSWVPGFLDEGR